MVGIVKKVIVLKGIGEFSKLRAVLRLEQSHFGIKTEVNVSEEFLGKKDFSIAIYDGSHFCYGKNNHDFDKIILQANGLSAGLVCDKKLVSFGASGISPANKDEMNELLDNNTYFVTQSASEQLQSTIYDDEQITEVNYYDQCYQNSTKEQNHQYVQAEAECEKSKENADAGNQTCQDETVSGIFQSYEQGYYSKIGASLTSLFCRGTKITELERVIPKSKWVKIDYTANQYYIVGIIEENGQADYICYGVPGLYGSPPEKLKEFSCFVPKNLFNVSDGGYYMMFQSAKSGEKIAPKIDIFGF